MDYPHIHQPFSLNFLIQNLSPFCCNLECLLAFTKLIEYNCYSFVMLLGQYVIQERCLPSTWKRQVRGKQDDVSILGINQIIQNIRNNALYIKVLQYLPQKVNFQVKRCFFPPVVQLQHIQNVIIPNCNAIHCESYNKHQHMPPVCKQEHDIKYHVSFHSCIFINFMLYLKSF